jgi:hypothetical protein
MMYGVWSVEGGEGETTASHHKCSQKPIKQSLSKTGEKNVASFHSAAVRSAALQRLLACLLDETGVAALLLLWKDSKDGLRSGSISKGVLKVV